MTKEKKDNQKENFVERPPVVCILGHVDHGKSTLLDYIRETNVADGEVGGITQKISAYEVNHKDKEGEEHKITFLDTPGHEAFCNVRTQGAGVADVGVLVVSVEDGVKPQTKEALECIKKNKLPFIVAINKLDKTGSNVDSAKQSLAEAEIFVEGYGGDVPAVGISAKTGQGVDELLDLILLTTQLEELKGDENKKAEGTVIEAHLDPKKGTTATIIIKDGTLKKSQVIVAGKAMATAKCIEDFTGKVMDQASFSSPVVISGFDALPEVGGPVKIFEIKKEAEKYLKDSKNDPVVTKTETTSEDDTALLPLILKADLKGSLDALEYEVSKIKHDKLKIKIVQSGIGDITENDIKSAFSKVNALILGFNVKVDSRAKAMAERSEIKVQTFDIIYKLTEWLEKHIKENAPKTLVEELDGRAKILRVFSSNKAKHIVGGKIQEGKIKTGDTVKILRRDNEIGNGKIKGLQQQKSAVKEVEQDEFGAEVESSIEFAEGDLLESFTTVEK